MESRPQVTLPRLTPHESCILDLFVAGVEREQIASCMNLSDGAVAIHLTSLCKKFGAKGPSALAARVRSARRKALGPIQAQDCSALFGPKPTRLKRGRIGLRDR